VNKNVEDIYPLSPQQQGMLFESLSSVESGKYVEQNVYDLKGGLNLAAFQRAWQSIVERHPVLRTAFVWKNVPEPLQVVLRQVEAPLEQHDWRQLLLSEQKERLQSYLLADRRRGFELTRAPLMRLAMIRTGEMSNHFVWTLHHILMDGWCMPVIIDEFSSFYEAFCAGQDLRLAPAKPYRDYIAWLKRQDSRQAEAYWRQTLAGFTTPTSLGNEDAYLSSPTTPESHGKQEARLSAAVTSMLLATARRRRLTLSTLVHGVWALLLSRYSGQQDLVFGTTVSGRPTELADVEKMIGLFISSLPFRVTVPRDASLWNWLEGLQNQHLELRQYEYCSTGQVHQWSGMAGRLPLYESLIVYENYPAGIRAPAAGTENGNGSEYEFTGARTGYPLTILISTGTELVINAIFDATRLDEAGVSRILKHYLALLQAIAPDSEPNLAMLLEQIPETETPAVRALLKSRAGSVNGDFVRPQTRTEEVIAGLAADVLGLEQVSVNDNFFSLGGHSLLVIQLLSRLRDTFKVDLPLPRLFATPTVSGWGETIDTILWAARGAAEIQAASGNDYEEGEL
jgi:aryl carrier-like protein